MSNASLGSACMCAQEVWGTLPAGLDPWTYRPMDPTMDGRTMDETRERGGKGDRSPLLLTTLLWAAGIKYVPDTPVH